MSYISITLTAKFKLKTNPDIEASLFNTTNIYIEALNYISTYVADNKLFNASAVKIHNQIYYDIRNKFNLPSQMACSAIRNVVGSYKSLKSNKKLYIKGKLNKPTFNNPYCDLVFNRDYSFKDNMFSISTINGRIKIPFYSKGREQYLTGDWTFGTAKLFRKNNSWYFSISMSKNIDEPTITNKVGIDLGINFIAVSYNGNKTKFYNGKGLKEVRAHYKILRKELQSKGTKSAKRKLKAIGARESRFVNNVNHCIAKALVLDNPNSLLILEDLSNIRPALAKVTKKNRYVMVSWPYADLASKIEYKALLNGCETTRVNPKYTSQTCPICGYKDKLNRDHRKHIFKCKNCGYTSNDDRIAAINLYNKG